MVDLARYGFDATYQQVYDVVDRHGRATLHALGERMDREDWFPEEAFRGLAKLGILGATLPERYGGAGLSVVGQAVAAEALSKWNPALASSYLSSDNLCANNILRNASEALKSKYLPRFCDGSAIGALGLTEPGAGSDALGGMRTTAVHEGEHYVLNGRKLFITNGPVADLVLVYAKTAPERGAHGISAFLVERGTRGFTVAQELDKMGWRGCPTGELVFEDCAVPAENLVGTEHEGVAVVMSGLDIERVVFAVHAIGIAERALELSVEYARTRRQFDRAIGEFQLVQALLADMYTDLETMRCATYQVLREVEHLEPGGGGRGEVHLRTAAVLLHAGRAAMRVLDNAVQVHGGMGYMRETEINRLYRVGKILEIGAGTTQVRQLIVGRELMDSYGRGGPTR
jgi:isovaleryl-CoA dehydrogenase